MTKIAEKLIHSIEEQGWKVQIVPIERLADLKEVLLGLYQDGLLDESFYEERLTHFSFTPPEITPEMKSIIVIAVPVPQVKTIFHWEGKSHPLIIPPTYVGYQATTTFVQAEVTAFLQKEGYHAAAMSLPLKTLAVSSGLATYGRNNICYVPGMGSFLQLVGLYSDLPCSQDPWCGPKIMQQCERCVACIRKCPTGAISQERFLIQAELCLTFHNEREIDFPAWIDPSWHNCLVGCMRCQNICPENKEVLSWIEGGITFSEQESSLLLDHVPSNHLPEEAAGKLQALELTEDIEILRRNLSAYLER